MGGAQCVWGDLKALEAMIGRAWPGWIVAANDVGSHLSVLHHWVTLHPEKMRKWEKDRRDNGHPTEYIRWGRRIHPDLDLQAKSWGGGSSGLLAVAVAVDKLGAERVVLCGTPLNRTPHFDESTVHPTGKTWSSANSHWRVWTKDTVKARLKDRVRSMSGRTRDLLGEPTAEWLNLDKKDGER